MKKHYNLIDQKYINTLKVYNLNIILFGQNNLNKNYKIGRNI